MTDYGRRAPPFVPETAVSYSLKLMINVGRRAKYPHFLPNVPPFLQNGPRLDPSCHRYTHCILNVRLNGPPKELLHFALQTAQERAKTHTALSEIWRQRLAVALLCRKSITLLSPIPINPSAHHWPGFRAIFFTPFRCVLYPGKLCLYLPVSLGRSGTVAFPRGLCAPRGGLRAVYRWLIELPHLHSTPVEACTEFEV